MALKNPNPSPNLQAMGIDVNALLQILIAQLLSQLPTIIAGLMERMNDKDEPAKPAEPDPEDIVSVTPPDTDEPNIPVPATRVAKRIETKVFWITRKVTPYKAGGGRKLLSDAAKARIVAGSDPLQAGDRVCFDDTPYDQDNDKFHGEKPLTLIHNVGGVGELQVQEENDYTPVVLVPWEDENVRPGFQGEISYQCGSKEGITGNKITLRVRPWGA